jgi:hypothetical protein
MLASVMKGSLQILVDFILYISYISVNTEI